MSLAKVKKYPYRPARILLLLLEHRSSKKLLSARRAPFSYILVKSPVFAILRLRKPITFIRSRSFSAGCVTPAALSCQFPVQIVVVCSPQSEIYNSFVSCYIIHFFYYNLHTAYKFKIFHIETTYLLNLLIPNKLIAVMHCFLHASP